MSVSTISGETPLLRPKPETVSTPGPTTSSMSMAQTITMPLVTQTSTQPQIINQNKPIQVNNLRRYIHQKFR